MPESALANIGQAFSATVTQQARSVPVSAEQAARGAIPPGEWTAEILHDYIAEEIERCGPQFPCRESLIIAGEFRQRFGAGQAARIAMAAFSAYGGIWKGAPITWRRFTSSNDEFFGRRILEALGG